jgi:uncharacterized protein YodC (DUF2158 family)
MENKSMAFEPGDVVMLKSGGQPMTVVTVEEEEVDCVWMSDQGDLFRESIPVAALMSIGLDDEFGDEPDEEDESEEDDDSEEDEDDEDDEDDENDEDEDEDEDDDDEDEDEEAKAKRRAV